MIKRCNCVLCLYIRKYHSITHMDFVWSKFNLVSRSNFFKTWKNYYIPEICKNSKATQLRIHKTDTAVDFTFGRSFSALQKRKPSFWCSFTNIAWSHGINERNQNNSAAKALRMLIFLWRSQMQLLVTS